MYIKIDTFCPSSHGEHPVLGWIFVPEDPSWVVHPWENEPQPEAENWAHRCLKTLATSLQRHFRAFCHFPTRRWRLAVLAAFPLSTFQFIKCQLFFLSHHEACGILDPWPGIEPGAPEMKVPNPNHWTTRKFPIKGNDGRTLLKWWVQDEISAPRGTWPALGTVRLWVTLHTFVRVNRRNLTSS